MRRSPGHHALRAAGIGVVLAAPLLAGCQKVLFPKNEPRTQFEVYDRMRSGYIPLEEPDVFGKPQPALRSRLSRQR